VHMQTSKCFMFDPRASSLYGVHDVFLVGWCLTRIPGIFISEKSSKNSVMFLEGTVAVTCLYHQNVCCVSVKCE
jgi:hypothetical protein